jgi:hypothetical protein
MFKRSGACSRTTPLKYSSHIQHAPLLLNIPVTCNTHYSSEASLSHTVLYVKEMFKRSGACCMWLGYLKGVVRVLSDWYFSKEWCVLYFTGIFKRSSTCYMWQWCFRGVMRVTRITPLKHTCQIQHVPLLLNIPVTYNTLHSSETYQSLKTRTTPLKYPEEWCVF